jgi:hypothetical protein
MNKLISCHYNMDTNRVEARFEDGPTLAIDWLAVEANTGDPGTAGRTIWLLSNNRWVRQMVLNGD